MFFNTVSQVLNPSLSPPLPSPCCSTHLQALQRTPKNIVLLQKSQDEFRNERESLNLHTHITCDTSTYVHTYRNHIHTEILYIHTHTIEKLHEKEAGKQAHNAQLERGRRNGKERVARRGRAGVEG